MISCAPVKFRTLARHLALITSTGLKQVHTNPAVSSDGMRRSERIASQYLAVESKRFYSSNWPSGKVVVEHDPKAGRFFIILDAFSMAHLSYNMDGEVIRLVETVVPEPMEGRGLGKILAKAALEYVARNDLRMEVQCDFVRHFMYKYEPKYIKYLAN